MKMKIYPQISDYAKLAIVEYLESMGWTRHRVADPHPSTDEMDEFERYGQFQRDGEYYGLFGQTDTATTWATIDTAEDGQIIVRPTEATVILHGPDKLQADALREMLDEFFPQVPDSYAQVIAYSID